MQRVCGDLWASPSYVGGTVLGTIAERQPLGSTDRGVEGLGASSCSSAMPPTRKVVKFCGQGRITAQVFSDVKPDLLLLPAFGDTFLHGFLQRRTLFGMCGGITSLFPTLGFLWSWVQMEIPKGAAEPLIGRGTGRRRLAPAWRLRQGTLLSL